ncbi:1-phosphatidylinositol-4-phosphate 5-kinase [Malassezia sp. CBS 17886]|nr:1-phosphatidylinositol-4-phosphate 5-kinase [Malassezia sp. CBS 17886]
MLSAAAPPTLVGASPGQHGEARIDYMHAPPDPNDPLSIIRRALGAEEHLIRVSDATTRETYDVTLSRTTPYASPYVTKTVDAPEKSDADACATPSAAHPSRRRRAARWIRSSSNPTSADADGGSRTPDDAAGPRRMHRAPLRPPRDVHTAGTAQDAPRPLGSGTPPRSAGEAPPPVSLLPPLACAADRDTGAEDATLPTAAAPSLWASIVDGAAVPPQEDPGTPSAYESASAAPDGATTPASNLSPAAHAAPPSASPRTRLAPPLLSLDTSCLSALGAPATQGTASHPLDPRAAHVPASGLLPMASYSPGVSDAPAADGSGAGRGGALLKPSPVSPSSGEYGPAHTDVSTDAVVRGDSSAARTGAGRVRGAYSRARHSPTQPTGFPASPGRRLSMTTSMSSVSSGMPAEPTSFDAEMAQNADMLRRSRRAKGQTQQRGPHSPTYATTSETNAHALRPVRRDDDVPHVLVGNLIGEGHENYVLMYHMLTGIRIGVSRCESRPRACLTAEDFSARYKFTFDIIGNELNPSSTYDFKFKDYAPNVFRALRQHFHLDTADYLLSLTAKYILSELGSPGKSGSFFYFSRDYRFIIKTIRHSEHKFLMKILPAYYYHVTANPHTLLSQFYGVHRVKLPGGRKIHFVIMKNLFPPHRDIHETYDLKGSTVSREQTSTKQSAVLKDTNWIKRKRYIEFGPEKREMFERQLRSDVGLLQRLEIMDYSLLIGLHDLSIGNKNHLLQDALQVFEPAPDGDADAQSSPTSPSATRPNIVVSATEAPSAAADVSVLSSPTSKHAPTGDKDPHALRTALRKADPKQLSAQTATKLPNHMAERRHFAFYQDEGGIRSTNEENEPTNFIYYLGIIDLFTRYNAVKKGEHFWKSIWHDHRAISSVNPRQYGERFMRFLLRRPPPDRPYADAPRPVACPPGV